MKRIFLQYAGLAVNLGAMFWAVAYLRRVSDAAYLGQMAAFLVLLAWSTPFETSFGNVLISAAKTQPEAIHRLLGGAFNRLVIAKALLIAVGFAIAFSFYLRKGTGIQPLIVMTIGGVFFVRLLEYVLKMKLLLKNLGQEAQIIANFFTAAKWLAAAGFLFAGTRSFLFFGVAHLGIGIASLLILSIIFLFQKSHIVSETISRPPPLTLRDDFISVFGMALGVIAYQIDKLMGGYFFSPAHFGEYVSIYTLAVVGPYIINPVVNLVLQRLTLAELTDSGSLGQIRAITGSLIRITALSFHLVLPGALIFFLNITSKPVSVESQENIALFVACSYFNCLVHVYYIRYLAKGDLRSILLQNMSATLTAVMIGFALFSLNSNRFAFILVGASIGQLAYGAYEDQRRLAALDVRIGAPVVLFIAYLSAYSIAYPFGHYYLYFSVASVFIFVIALYMELAILQLRLREAPAAFRALVA